MCLEPENDACGLRWCVGLQMSFLTQRLASFGLVVIQQLASVPVIIYWKFSLRLVRGFSWRTPGEHFHFEKESSALFCKAQGILFLNTPPWNCSWRVPASVRDRHLVMFAATLFVCLISVNWCLPNTTTALRKQCPCQSGCWISPPVMWDTCTWQLT